MRFLPHVNNSATGARNIVCDDESKNRLFDYLYKELSQREKESNNKHFIIFFYDEYGFQSHPLSKFVSKGKELNTTFVFMDDHKGLVPLGCDYLISMQDNNNGILTDVANVDKNVYFSFEPISDNVACKVVSLFAPVYTEEISLEGTLTKNI